MKDATCLPTVVDGDYDDYFQVLTRWTGSKLPVLDARSKAEYQDRRLKDSVNIPLDLLPSNAYLLPDKPHAFGVIVPCGIVVGQQLKGCKSLPEFLHTRGWNAVAVYLRDSKELWKVAAELQVLEQGPLAPEQVQQRQLFKPCLLLSQEIARIEGALALKRQPTKDDSGQWTIPLRALDLGCGSGRDLAWLACRVPEVTARPWDDVNCILDSTIEQLPSSAIAGSAVSSSAANDTAGHSNDADGLGCVAIPAHIRWHVTGVDEWYGALCRAEGLFKACGLPCAQAQLHSAAISPQTGMLMPVRLKPMQHGKQHQNAHDVHTHFAGNTETLAIMQPPNPHGQFDLVLCVRFLQRACLDHIPRLLRPGGFLLYCTFMDMPGVRKFGRPSGHDHLLQPGELAVRFGKQHGFQILRDDVMVLSDGRELSMFVACKTRAEGPTHD